MRGGEDRLQTSQRSMAEGMDGLDSLVQFGRHLFAGHALQPAVDDVLLSRRERHRSGEDLRPKRIVVEAGRVCERIRRLRLGTEVAGSKLLPPCSPLRDVPALVLRDSQEPAAYRRLIPKRLNPSPRDDRRHLNDVFGPDRPAGIGTRSPKHSSAVYRQPLAQQLMSRVRTGHRTPPLPAAIIHGWPYRIGARATRAADEAEQDRRVSRLIDLVALAEKPGPTRGIQTSLGV